MPERVTKKERTISLTIEKARNAKEQLALSMENNRSPSKDESEHVKLKRPKAENYTYKGKSNDGPINLHAYAGEITKAVVVLKNIKESDYLTNPFLDEEDRTIITERIESITRTITALKEQFDDSDKPEDMSSISRMITSLSGLVGDLEKEFRRLPEPRDEESDEALDPDYDKFIRPKKPIAEETKPDMEMLNQYRSNR
jgi:hypothetical protein